jgi:hypothetical protein
MKQLTINSLLLAFCFLANALYAQATGKLVGKLIYGATDEPVLFTLIQLLKNGEQIAIAESDMDGNYEFANIPAGMYELACEHAGLPPMRIAGLKIHSGRTCEYDIELSENISFPIETIYREVERPMIPVERGDMTSLKVFILDKKTGAFINTCSTTLITAEKPYYRIEDDMFLEAFERYSFGDLVTGTYKLEVKTPGYPTVIVQNIEIPTAPIGENHEQFITLYLDAEIPEDQVIVKKAVYMPKNN